MIYGHILLFAFGLVVMLIGPYDEIDTAQMILMGSPLLALVALSAYRFMANLPPGPDPTPAADPAWIQMSTITTAAFLVALFATYAMAAFNSAISAGLLKLIVGAIETVLGGYLGVNRDSMFPEVK